DLLLQGQVEGYRGGVLLLGPRAESRQPGPAPLEDLALLGDRERAVGAGVHVGDPGRREVARGHLNRNVAVFLGAVAELTGDVAPPREDAAVAREGERVAPTHRDPGDLRAVHRCARRRHRDGGVAGEVGAVAQLAVAVY